jgi:hypothetical protein
MFVAKDLLLYFLQVITIRNTTIFILRTLDHFLLGKYIR